VYEVIGEPPLKGAAQVITTLVFDTTVVTGSAGVLGLAAALIVISVEYSLKPTKVLASILKLYI
jgi:hypothetical protein